MKSFEMKMTKHNYTKIDFIAAKTTTTKTYFCTYIIRISRKVLHLALSNSVSLYSKRTCEEESEKKQKKYSCFSYYYGSYIEMLI